MLLTLSACSDAGADLSEPLADASPLPIVIVDGRSLESIDDLPEWSRLPPVLIATAQSRAYWQQNNTAFQDDFRAISLAHGSFTRNGASQHALLYLSSRWPRGRPNMGLAIIENDKLIRNIAFDSVTQVLRRLPDLDNDGLDELAAVGTFGMGGHNSSHLTLLSFNTGVLGAIAGVAIAESNCASGRPDRSTAARVLWQGGDELLVEKFFQRCDANTWQPVGEHEDMRLYPSQGDIYIDLFSGLQK